MSLFIHQAQDNTWKGAGYVGGSGSPTLTFVYKVKAGDRDHNGISIGSSNSNGSYGLVGGGTIMSVNTELLANTSYAKQNNLSGHKIDGSKNNKSFIFIWYADSTREARSLPLHYGYKYNFTVDWGDGSPIGSVKSPLDFDRVHIYSRKGLYKVTINGLVESLSFNNHPDRLAILSVSSLGDVGWKNLDGAFHGCKNLTKVRGGNVSQVISMSKMFAGTSINSDFSHWNFKYVRNMTDMFKSTNKFNTKNYSSMLVRISETTKKNNVRLDANSKYDSSAQNARKKLINRGWIINDKGKE